MPRRQSTSVIIGRGRVQRAARAELIAEIARAEGAIRAMASRWGNGLAPAERLRLHRIANRLLKILLREGKS